jgi:hypothetical protein
MIPSKHGNSARRIALRTTVVNQLVIAVCALLTVSRANAHPEFSPISTNRYLKLDLVGPDEVRLAYTLMYGAGPALAERKRADSNADCRLDESETKAMGERLRAAVTASLKLSLDGQPVPPGFEPATVGLAGAEVAPNPFSIDLSARLHASGPGPHSLVLDDNTEIAQLGETEIRVEESPQTRLLESHRGQGPGPRQSPILFRGPRFSALEDRSITVRWEGTGAPPRSDDKSVRRVGLLVTVGLTLVLLVGWVVLRRYRNMNG